MTADILDNFSVEGVEVRVPFLEDDTVMLGTTGHLPLDGDQVLGDNTALPIEVLLIANHLHSHISETKGPHVEVGSNFVLNL